MLQGAMVRDIELAGREQHVKATGGQVQLITSQPSSPRPKFLGTTNYSTVPDFPRLKFVDWGLDAYCAAHPQAPNPREPCQIDASSTLAVTLVPKMGTPMGARPPRR